MARRGASWRGVARRGAAWRGVARAQLQQITALALGTGMGRRVYGVESRATRTTDIYDPLFGQESGPPVPTRRNGQVSRFSDPKEF